jgi:nicotinamidase-related amidase
MYLECTNRAIPITFDVRGRDRQSIPLYRGEAKSGTILWMSCVPWRGEIVIDKAGSSAFWHTTLQQMSDGARDREAYQTGITTEVCVSSTLRAAVDLGNRCITMSDACASSDPVLHKSALAMIEVEGGVFGEVVTVLERFAR